MTEKTFSLPDVDSLDEVPEEFRAFYFEKEGQVKRQDPGAMAATMAKLRREMDQVGSTLKEREKALNAYQEALGDDADPEVLRQLKEKAQRAESAPTDQEVEKRIKAVEDNFKKQLGLKEQEIASRESIIENVLIQNQIRDALRQADANDDGIDLLPKLMRDRVQKVYLDGGKIELVPLDEDGTRKFTEDGQEATLLDLANEYKAKRPIFFNGTSAKGFGSSGEPVNLPQGAKDWKSMTPMEKSEFRAKHGAKAAQAMISKSLSRKAS